jgi:hypothetical protein
MKIRCFLTVIIGFTCFLHIHCIVENEEATEEKQHQTNCLNNVFKKSRKKENTIQPPGEGFNYDVLVAIPYFTCTYLCVDGVIE